MLLNALLRLLAKLSGQRPLVGIYRGILFAGKLLKDMEQGKYRRILLMSTGALLSTISPFQGESIPGIAHAVALEVE